MLTTDFYRYDCPALVDWWRKVINACLHWNLRCHYISNTKITILNARNTLSFGDVLGGLNIKIENYTLMSIGE